MSEELPWRYACVCRNTKEGEIALLCEMGVEGIWRKAKQRCLWSHLASFNRFFSILWNLYPVTFLSSLSPFHFLSYKVQIHVQCRWCRKHGFDPRFGKIPWRVWQPTPVFLPGESHAQRSLVGYSPQGSKELDITEGTEYTCSTKYELSRITMWKWFQPECGMISWHIWKERAGLTEFLALCRLPMNLLTGKSSCV